MKLVLGVIAFVAFFVIAAMIGVACRNAAIDSCHEKGGHVVSGEWWQDNGKGGGGTYWNPSCMEGSK